MIVAEIAFHPSRIILIPQVRHHRNKFGQAIGVERPFRGVATWHFEFDFLIAKLTIRKAIG